MKNETENKRRQVIETENERRKVSQINTRGGESMKQKMKVSDLEVDMKIHGKNQ